MAHALEAWTNFYLIIGPSAGALTGLQFVVVALVADTHNARGFTNTSPVFATPTVVHFSFVLVLSGILAAPWPGPGTAMIVVGAAGAGGVIYSVITGLRARRQEQYRPVAEDWLFHVWIPGGAYLTMAIAALLSSAHLQGALFAIAGSSALLLVVGIHNAWDTVTYIVATRAKEEAETPGARDPKPPERKRHR